MYNDETGFSALFVGYARYQDDGSLCTKKRKPFVNVYMNSSLFLMLIYTLVQIDTVTSDIKVLSVYNVIECSYKYPFCVV